MKRIIALLLTCLFILTSCSGKLDYKYLSAEEVKQNMENLSNIRLIDLQAKRDWERFHILTSIPTHASPLRSKADKKKLKGKLDDFKEEESSIILIAKNDSNMEAERAYKFLLKEGFDQDRLYILKGGIEAWPFEELLN